MKAKSGVVNQTGGHQDRPYANPAAYWDSRLRAQFDLGGVGQASLGASYNEHIYQARLRSLERAFGVVGGSMAGRRVLEIGCGTGFYTAYCARQGVKGYLGIDIAAVSVTALQAEYPRFQFRQVDIGQAAWDAGGQFEIVLEADVLFHIIDDHAFDQALGNMAAALRPGGLLITSAVLPRASARVAEHVRHRSRAHYEAQFETNGLNLRHIEPISALLYPPPPIPGSGLGWKLIGLAWLPGRLLARLPLTSDRLGRALAWLDERLVMRRWGSRSPFPKWMIAVKQ